MSCGSPMPRGERIAKPAEWGHPRGRLFFGGRRSRIADRQREETMNAYGRLLVGTLATGLVWLRPALGQDTAVTASSLARVLAEVAQDIRTGRPVYLVATLKFPQYVIGEFETREQAQRLAADSGAGYGVFGPYVTPADR